jgi:SAM-dependent methyltransferase
MVMSPIIPNPNSPEMWSERADTAPTSWEACGWTYLGQLDRARRVAAELDPQPGETILDYGCGTGALTDQLPAQAGYVGYDRAEGMIRRAEREHPGWRFQRWEPSGPFDLIACVGPFNLPGGWAKQDTFHHLRYLWDKTRRVLVASLYAGVDESCLIYSEAELEAFGRQLGYFVSVERWRHNDLLLVARR